MRFEGSYRVKIGSSTFSGRNTLLWKGVLEGLKFTGSKDWRISFLREVAGKSIRANSYLEFQDMNAISTSKMEILEVRGGTFSMEVVFMGYPGAIPDVDGIMVANGDNIAISIFKFKNRISLESNMKVTIVWKVEVRGI